MNHDRHVKEFQISERDLMAVLRVAFPVLPPSTDVVWQRRLIRGDEPIHSFLIRHADFDEIPVSKDLPVVELKL